MIPIIDSHLDLGWNALGFERDLTLPVDEINHTEAGLADSAARGGAIVSLPELRRGNAWLCFGTLLARGPRGRRDPSPAAPRVSLDHRQSLGAHCAAHGQLAWYRRMEAEGQVALIGTREQLDAFWLAKTSGDTSAVGIVLVMEGADPVADIEDLRSWQVAGLRQINLVHYGVNRYAAGTGAVGGLTSDGRAMLRACEELGIALDLTHLADQAFFEAVDLFQGPLLASHQNCRALVDGGRQFTDQQLRVVIDRGGVVGAAFDNWMLTDGWVTGVTPREAVTVRSVAEHIDHVCQLAGHHSSVGIGTDLDGGFGREQAPHGIEQIRDIQELGGVLSSMGYSDEQVAGVFHGNWLRWLRGSLPRGASDVQHDQSHDSLAKVDAAAVSLRKIEKPVLVLGAGSIGERHARCFQQTGRVDVALCEVDDSRLREVGDRLRVARRFSSLEEALQFPLAAAVIATPAPFHVAQADQFVRRKIPVLIEKPLGVTAEGVAELIARTQEGGATAAVAYVMRCHPVFVAVRSVVGAGEIGRPVELILQSGQCFPFYRPGFRETYYAQRASGGGAVQDALTHFINAAEWIVGPVTQVQGDTGTLLLDGVQVEDTVHVLARHQDLMATYTLNQHQAANETSLTIVGDRGMLRGELHSNTLRVQRSPQQAWDVRVLPPLERDQLFMRQANAFLDCIESGGPPLCSLSEAATTLACQIAILIASDSPIWKKVQAVAPRSSGLPSDRSPGHRSDAPPAGALASN